MKYTTRLFNKLEIFITQHRQLLIKLGKLLCFGITVWLLVLVFLKIGDNAPVILRANDFGFNFLTSRNVIWSILFLEILFLSINTILTKLFHNNYKVLSFLLKFVNIEILILCLFISCQIYLLNF